MALMYQVKPAVGSKRRRHASNDSNSWGPPTSDGSDTDSANSKDEVINDEGDYMDNEAFSDGISCESNVDGSDKVSIDGGEIKLRVIRQPEEQHRARYLSEGSRGAIKDRSGKSHCTIQLMGYNRPTRVEIYAGTGNGPVQPHSLYRVIPVTGKGGQSLATPCQSLASNDGVPCLAVELRPEYNMTAVLDCVGILKICTYNMKRRMPKSSKNSTVRLVFRAAIPNPKVPNDTVFVQTLSSPIICVQQLGQPEVYKTSTQTSPCTGGVDMFVIGRNFDRNTTVLFREYKEDGKLSWSSEAVIDKKLLHQCHLVCSVPTYRDLNIGGSVEVSMTVKCGSKSSHPMPFYYQSSNAFDTAPNLLPMLTTVSRSRGASTSSGNPNDWAPSPPGSGHSNDNFSNHGVADALVDDAPIVIFQSSQLTGGSPNTATIMIPTSQIKTDRQQNDLVQRQVPIQVLATNWPGNINQVYPVMSNDTVLIEASGYATATHQQPTTTNIDTTLASLMPVQSPASMTFANGQHQLLNQQQSDGQSSGIAKERQLTMSEELTNIVNMLQEPSEFCPDLSTGDCFAKAVAEPEAKRIRIFIGDEFQEQCAAIEQLANNETQQQSVITV